MIAHIEDHFRRSEQSHLPTAVAVPATDSRTICAQLTVGDRIEITNRIRRPTHWIRPWSVDNERRATVTRIDPSGKVFFTTDNGVKTWRYARNVKRLANDE